MDLTDEQLARLLAKSMREPRKNRKLFLHDLGGEGTAEELDRVLDVARSNPHVVEAAQRLD